MTRIHAAAATTSLLTLLALAGCGSDTPTEPAAAAANTAQLSDRAAIEALIADAPEFDATFTDDEGELLGEATTASAVTGGLQVAATDSSDMGATSPVHWGRLRRPHDQPPVRTVEFTLGPDGGRALVKVNVKFDGWFFVDRTDDGIRNPGKKPLQDQVTRYALFKKIWFCPDTTSTDSVYGWRLLAVSPSEFTMIDPAKQTVDITSVTFTGERSHVTITDPSALLSLRRTDPPLPHFRAGEEVKVEAAVTNTDTGFDPSTFVYLHVPISDRICPGPRERIRVRMWDNGRGGDAVAGDGVYTTIWTVRDRGLHHAAVDVINARTLQNETEDDYNSTTWGIPYAAFPSFLP